MIERVIQTAAAFDPMQTIQHATLADKLSGERHRWFIGRHAELRTFEAVLADSTCSLLFVHGTTGVGKSSLLQELERACQEKGHPAALIDASVMASREAQNSQSDRLRALFEGRRGRSRGLRPVLLVDSFESLGAYEQPLVVQLGHTLPADALLVFASRKWPPQWLRIDPAWSRLSRFQELSPWSDEEATRFLAANEIAPAVAAEISKIAGGYPLTLQVAVQIFRASRLDSFEASSIRRLQAALAPMFSIRTSSRTQQVAMDVCILVRHTSLELLDYVLRSNADCDPEGAPEVFEWLANHTFIERHDHQLRPHAVARLTMRVRVRREQKYQAIFRPVREFYVNELARGSRADADFDELFFIDRDIEVLRDQDLAAVDEPPLTIARGADHSEVIALVGMHEGEISAEYCRRWLEAAPDSFEIGRRGGVQKLLQITRIAGLRDIPLRDGDPASRLAARYVAEHALEEGAVATFFRWFMNRADYQSPSASVLGITARQTQVIVSLPRVQYSLCVFRSVDEWAPMWDSLNCVRELVGTFELDAQQYSLIAFPFAEHSLRETVVGAYRVAPPNPPPSPRVARSSPASEGGEARAALEQRISELSRKCHLTTREAEVLLLLSLAKSIEEIALSLNITARTVRFHQGNLFRKIGATSRIDLFRHVI